MSNTEFSPDNLLNYDQESDNYFVIAIFNVLIILLAVFLLTVSFFQLCEVRGPSMQNTLNKNLNEPNDYLLVTRFKTDYNYKDIIVLDVYDDFKNETIRVVKRVIAVADESFIFEADSTHVYLYKFDENNNKYLLDESDYIKEKMKRVSFNTLHFKIGTKYTVPENCVLFLGDNRNDSNDSRYYGFASLDIIVGKSVLQPEKYSILEKILLLIYPKPDPSDTDLSLSY